MKEEAASREIWRNKPAQLDSTRTLFVGEQVELESTSVIESTGVTHLTFRVVK